MNIQPIVEGHGEVAAVPVLLRRLLAVAEVYAIDVNPPHRKHRADFFDKERIQNAVRRARNEEDCGAILLLFDGDEVGDCPATQCPSIREWAREEAGPIPCEVVMAYREYEAWFLAAMESLRSQRGVRKDAASHPDPENPRGAKRHLQDRMEPRRTYAESTDQPALTAHFDLVAAYQRCRSFKQLVKAFGRLAGGLGAELPAWPPPEWEAPAG